MQNRDLEDKIKTSLCAFRERLRADQAFRTLARDALQHSNKNISIADIFTLALSEALAHAYPADNYEAGKRRFEEAEIRINRFEVILIPLISDDETLKQYAEKLLAYDRHYLTRIATFLGMPTERPDFEAQQSFKNLGKTFIGYADDGTVLQNILNVLWWSLFNLTIVSIKVFISIIKIVTELLPYYFSEVNEIAAKKFYANLNDQQTIATKAFLYLGFGITKFFAYVGYGFYFFGRAISSPAKGIIGAIREGASLGGDNRKLSNVLAFLAAITSLTITIGSYLVLIPIKLTISFNTTIPFFAHILPRWIVQPITFLKDKVSPSLLKLGDTLGKILSPIIGPVSRFFHENLTVAQFGLGAYAGVVSATTEILYTFYGSKLLRGVAVGFVGTFVAASALLVSLVRKKPFPMTAEETHPISTSTSDILLSLKPNHCERSHDAAIQQSPQVLRRGSLRNDSRLFSADSLNLVPQNCNHTQTIRHSGPTQ